MGVCPSFQSSEDDRHESQCDRPTLRRSESLIHYTVTEEVWAIPKVDNSLCPSEARWWLRTVSTLAQLWQQAIYWTSVDWSLARSCGTHVGAISWDILMVWISKMGLNYVFDIPASAGRWWAKISIKHEKVVYINNITVKYHATT